jgi:3-isopropylmalate/(R)-2-methylmalate dehydratase small subunit
LDDIGWTLQFEEKIQDYEQQARQQKPWLFFDV